MKNIFKYLGVMLFAVLGLTACSPDSFSGADPNGIPSLDGVDPVVQVDQNINQVTFSLPSDMKGVMPVWIFYEHKGTEKQKITYSTVNGLKKIFATAGDYECEFKLMNRNGLSDGSKSFKFHIDKTLIDFGKYFTMLCGGKNAGDKKEWRIDNAKEGHLGCGDHGTDGLGWWKAGPDDKKAFGVYDNRVTFGVTSASDGGSYTFNPGEAGTIYANKCVTAFGGPMPEDYTAPATVQERTFQFDVVGNDLFIVLPENTFFPYIPGDEFWANPRLKVESLTGAEINLIADIKTADNPNGIAWHFILTSGEAKQEFKGFKYDSEFNIWKPADAAHTYTQYNAQHDGWDPATTPEVVDNKDGKYSFTLVEETVAQWQSQFALIPDSPIALNAGTNYDFSVIINPNNDVKAATVKLTEDGNDSNFLFEERVSLTAYEDNIIWFHNLPGIDASKVKLVFDFAPAPANTEINIKNIVVKDASKDDGTVLPQQEDPLDPTKIQWVDANSDANLMNGGALSVASTYWAAGDDWHGCEAPSVETGKRTAKIHVNEANGGAQWQGQVHLNTNVAIVEGKCYDFLIKINPSQNITGCTVKPHPQGDDSHYFSEGRHDLVGYETNTVTYDTFTADFSTSNLVITLDFPSCEAGAEIKVEEIIIQEHQGPVAWVDVDSADNLMTKGTFDLASTYWAAGDDWHGCAAPEVAISGRNSTINVVEANGGAQWQGQVHYNTGVKIEEGKTYDFCIKLNPSQNITGCTVKPHPQGDDSHYFSEGRHDLQGYEDNMVTYEGFTADFSTDNLVITLDFPSCEAGATIDVKNIIVQLHK